MNLKKIEPGMVVHVKNDEEYKELLKEAKRLGYRWLSGKDIEPEIKDSLIRSYSIKFNESNDFRYFKNIGFVPKSDKATEFSDLVLPELTAEEVFSILDEIRDCTGRRCEECPLSSGNNNGISYCAYDHGVNVSDGIKLIEICQKWKSDHEKKEPEIEAVDLCRIIEIQPDGKKRCVYEEDMKNIPVEEGKVCPSNRVVQKKCREILKNYCMEHEGDFIAVHETVCRVKK